MMKNSNLKHKLHVIIDEANTPMGKAFDVLILVLILVSVLVVMLDSVLDVHEHYSTYFYILEWIFTAIFTLEYVTRIYITVKPFRNYIFTFYGIIDFLSILPTYLSLIFSGTQLLMVIRILRVLRLFKILKLNRFVEATDLLKKSLINSRFKILVFMELVFTIVIIMGSIMYLVEGPEGGFTSIPRGIYWAIVTLTTVGYGDIAPVTVLGQMIASLIMLMGYAIIAVPTGILSSEMFRSGSSKMTNINTQVCENCGHKTHDDDAKYCKICGHPLN